MTETPTTEPESQQPATPPAKDPESLKVIIRPWPKVIFLYPTMLMAFACWIFTLFAWDDGVPPAWVAEGAPAAAAADTAPASPDAETDAETDAAASTTSGLGNWFVIVFFLNLLVFSFDFSRIKSITIVIAIAAIGFGLAWADNHWVEWELTGGIMGALDAVNIQMNTQFYGWVAAFLFVCLLLVLINTRFNYYEINHREILHHHGYLGDITRVPTQGLRFNKEIYDLMEDLLLRSGRLIFVTPTSHEAIVIDNVPNVNKVESQIKNLLSVLAVRMA